MSTAPENCDAPTTAASPRRKALFLLLAVAAMDIILLLPTPGPIDTGTQTIMLTVQGKAALAVLVAAVLLWVSEALPFAVTGLAAMVMMVVTRAAPFTTLVRDGFGNHIILFFIGVLIFSAAIGHTKLMSRIAALALYKLGHSPRLIVLAFLTVGMLLSGWITDMAVAAMLYPIGLGLLRGAGLKPLQSNFGRALMIACAWGPLIGGISTPAGCGPNPLTIGFLKDLAGVDFSFWQWMAIGYPAALLMLPLGWLVLLKIFPLEKVDLAISEQDYIARKAELGPLTRQEIITLVIFVIMVTLWIAAPFIQQWTGGAIDYLGISFVATACACLFFLPGFDVLSWREAEADISWGGIILIVTGLAMGMTIYTTGAAAWTAWVAFSWIGALHPVLIVFVIVLGVSLMKVMFSSNTVTGIIVVPLLIALARTLGLNPVLLAIPAGITSSLAFILVTSTPTNVIPYAGGYFSIGDMAKAGLWMTVVSSAAVTLSIAVIGPLLGLITW